MADLNEAGLSAAEAEFMNQIPRVGGIPMDPTEVVRGCIEAYFEHAEVDTRRRLHPTSRDEHIEGHTLKFVIGDVEGYLTMNPFPDGSLGELFIHGVGKEGSTVSGLLDLIAILISVALQYGVPLQQMTKFMKGMNFEPKDQYFTSIPDLIANYLEDRYGQRD